MITETSCRPAVPAVCKQHVWFNHAHAMHSVLTRCRRSIHSCRQQTRYLDASCQHRVQLHDPRHT
jgi:hypothetical protein